MSPENQPEGNRDELRSDARTNPILLNAAEIDKIQSGIRALNFPEDSSAPFLLVPVSREPQQLGNDATDLGGRFHSVLDNLLKNLEEVQSSLQLLGSVSRLLKAVRDVSIRICELEARSKSGDGIFTVFEHQDQESPAPTDRGEHGSTGGAESSDDEPNSDSEFAGGGHRVIWSKPYGSEEPSVSDIMSLLGRELVVLREALVDIGSTILLTDQYDALLSLHDELMILSHVYEFCDQEPQMHTSVTKAYFRRGVHRMVIRMEGANSVFKGFNKHVGKGIAAVQSRQTNLHLYAATGATFFAGVTASTLQFSVDKNVSGLDVAVNALWIGSLALSIGSAINSLLALLWRQAIYSSPQMVPGFARFWILQGYLILLTGSVICFLAGLICFATATQAPVTLGILVACIFVFLAGVVCVSVLRVRDQRKHTEHVQLPGRKISRKKERPATETDSRHHLIADSRVVLINLLKGFVSFGKDIALRCLSICQRLVVLVQRPFACAANPGDDATSTHLTFRELDGKFNINANPLSLFRIAGLAVIAANHLGGPTWVGNADASVSESEDHVSTPEGTSLVNTSADGRVEILAPSIDTAVPRTLQLSIQRGSDYRVVIDDDTSLSSDEAPPTGVHLRGEILQMQFSTDGRWLVTCSKEDAWVHELDESGKLILKQTLTRRQHKTNNVIISWLPSGDMFVIFRVEANNRETWVSRSRKVLIEVWTLKKNGDSTPFREPECGLLWTSFFEWPGEPQREGYARIMQNTEATCMLCISNWGRDALVIIDRDTDDNSKVSVQVRDRFEMSGEIGGWKTLPVEIHSSFLSRLPVRHLRAHSASYCVSVISLITSVDALLDLPVSGKVRGTALKPEKTTQGNMTEQDLLVSYDDKPPEVWLIKWHTPIELTFPSVPTERQTSDLETTTLYDISIRHQCKPQTSAPKAVDRVWGTSAFFGQGSKYILTPVDNRLFIFSTKTGKVLATYDPGPDGETLHSAPVVAWNHARETREPSFAMISGSQVKYGPTPKSWAGLFVDPNDIGGKKRRAINRPHVHSPAPAAPGSGAATTTHSENQGLVLHENIPKNIPLTSKADAGASVAPTSVTK